MKSSAVRAKSYDWWVQRFLDDCPECTVLHLGCGLDTRIYRVNPPSTVCWYDIDLPDVIALRQRLFPGRPGLQTVAASVTDAHLLDEIPGDQPVLVVAEGLTCYLPAADGVVMLRQGSPYTSRAGRWLSTATAGWGVAHAALRAGESLRCAAGLEHRRST